MEGKNFFLVVLYNAITIVDSTCPSNDVKCCSPGFSWNYDLNMCTAGCEIGFFGLHCESACRYPSYGKRCQQQCNCTQEFCDFASGCRNSSDCSFGYYGVACSDPCRFPSFGERCQYECNCAKKDCHHITGCLLGTEIQDTISVWNETSQESSRTFMEKIKTIIIIGGSLTFTFILIFVLVIIIMVRRDRRSGQRKEFECNFDSEFSSCHSSPDETVQGTCTTSARYVQSFDLNGKSVECHEFEIYENICIQGNS